MTQEQIDKYLERNPKMFSEENLPAIRERLEQLPESAEHWIGGITLRTPSSILITAWLIGVLGVDMFMIKKNGFGIFKLLVGLPYAIFYCKMKLSAGSSGSEGVVLLAGFFGIIYVVTFIITLIKGTKWTREYNFNTFMEETENRIQRN